MAAGRKFECNQCSQAFIAWDEGDPYYRDERGLKRYAYHPDRERDRCTDIEIPVLCLNCGKQAKIDSAKPISCCPRCKSTELVDQWHLDGKPCPFCKRGTFAVDPDFFLVS